MKRTCKNIPPKYEAVFSSPKRIHTQLVVNVPRYRYSPISLATALAGYDRLSARVLLGSFQPAVSVLSPIGLASICDSEGV